MGNLKVVFQSLFHLLVQFIVPVAIIIILLTSSTVAEVLTSLFLILVLIFYYANSIVAFLVNVSFLEKLNHFIAVKIAFYQSFVLEKFPEFNGIHVFGRQFLRFHVNNSFSVTQWPAYLLIAGIIVRLVLGKYVRNERLKQIGQEYWLYITTYLITALVVSYISDWSYIKILLASLIFAFVIAAGLLRIGADLIHGLLVTIGYIAKAGRVALMYLALFAARIARALRYAVRFVKSLYNTYILGPFYWLDKVIKNFLYGLEQKVVELLEKENIDE